MGGNDGRSKRKKESVCRLQLSFINLKCWNIKLFANLFHVSFFLSFIKYRKSKLKKISNVNPRLHLLQYSLQCKKKSNLKFSFSVLRMRKTEAYTFSELHSPLSSVAMWIWNWKSWAWKLCVFTGALKKAHQQKRWGIFHVDIHSFQQYELLFHRLFSSEDGVEIDLLKWRNERF